MSRLWQPRKPAVSRSIEIDMRRGARPNPYTITEADVGLSVFGAPIRPDEVGLRCQLVWNNAGDSAVFQIETIEQRDRRWRRSRPSLASRSFWR